MNIPIEIVDIDLEIIVARLVDQSRKQLAVIVDHFQ
jgi:hypothetical protein